MSSLYVLRHGMTDWNVVKKLQGQTDIPLNDEGIAMAKEAGEKYRDVHFDTCFCSPLVRARRTADLLLKGRDIPIEYDDRLKEIAFGDYEGLLYTELSDDHPVKKAFRDPEHFVPAKGGESIKQLIERTGDFLHEKVRPLLDKDMDVLIVGHGAMNSSIIVNVKELPVEEFWNEGIENCVLKRLI